MAYINKKDFSIINKTNIEDDEYEKELLNDYFECDDLIAHSISLLNKKGYHTLSCCSGHIFNDIDDFMSVEDDLDEEDKENIIRSVKLEEPIKDGDKEYSYLFSMYYDNNNMYIVFDNRYLEGYETLSFLTLKVNEIKINGEPHEVNILSANFQSSTNTIERMKEIIEKNIMLYRWIERLPNIKQEDTEEINESEEIIEDSINEKVVENNIEEASDELVNEEN